jgi:hypothetical protein
MVYIAFYSQIYRCLSYNKVLHALHCFLHTDVSITIKYYMVYIAFYTQIYRCLSYNKVLLHGLHCFLHTDLQMSELQ